MKLIGKQFRGGRQEDAHEFLILLLDAMQVCDMVIMIYFDN